VTLAAIQAASIGSVHEPHSGSAKGRSPRQRPRGRDAGDAFCVQVAQLLLRVRTAQPADDRQIGGWRVVAAAWALLLLFLLLLLAQSIFNTTTLLMVARLLPSRLRLQSVHIVAGRNQCIKI